MSIESPAKEMTRLLTINEVLHYLKASRNYFYRHIKPCLTPIPMGSRTYRYDILELNKWIEDNKGCDERRPITRGNVIWDINASQDSTKAEEPGISTKSSMDEDFMKTLEQARSQKRRKF